MLVCLNSAQNRRKRSLYRVSYGVMFFYFPAVRAGQVTIRSAASMGLTAIISPCFFGDVVSTSVALTGRAQAELLLLLVTRSASFFPRPVGWVLSNGFEIVASYSLCSFGAKMTVTSWLARQSLARQVLVVGFYANVVSALATATIQTGLNFLTLVRRSTSNPGVAAQQFYYDTVTALLSGCSAVAGGCAGTAVGGLLLPGVGTALGSLIGSLCASFVPCLLRSNGPEKRLAAEERVLMKRKLVVEDADGWLVVSDYEKDPDFVTVECVVTSDRLLEGPCMPLVCAVECRDDKLIVDGGWDVFDVENESRKRS